MHSLPVWPCMCLYFILYLDSMPSRALLRRRAGVMYTMPARLRVP